MLDPEFEQQLDNYFQQALDLPDDKRSEFVANVPTEFRERLQELVDAFVEEQTQFLEPLSDAVGQSAERQFEGQQRDLLFVILGWQAGLIPGETVSNLLKLWFGDVKQSVQDLCVGQQVLTEEQSQLLAPMVDAHIALHQGHTSAALESLSSVPHFIYQAIGDIDDPDLKGPLSIVGRSSRDRRVEAGETIPAGGERFRIVRKHASGGIGDVFVARDLELNREVALKEIHRQSSSRQEIRNRFRVEAEVTGRLEHPGIVPVYGLGQHADGRPFYAMKFVEGEDLKSGLLEFHSDRRMTRSERMFQFRALLKRFVDVCEAIAFAHSKGVLHRDLKPGNIMLGRYGETLVVDWGLARLTDATSDSGEHQSPSGTTSVSAETSATDETQDSMRWGSATETGAVVGTPRYMSPEQAAGQWRDVGIPSDVYSLGAVLYEILCGGPVVSPLSDSGERRDVVEILRLVREGQLQPIVSRTVTVPPALSAVCLKALSLKPEDRYQSAEDLAKDIELWLADEPVSAWREPVWVRAQRWIRRHQTLLSGTLAALLVAVAASLWIAKSSQDAAHQIQAKQKETEEALHAAGNLLAALDRKPLQWFRESTSKELHPGEKVSVYRIADAVQTSTDGLSFEDSERRASLQSLLRGLAKMKDRKSNEAVPLINESAIGLASLRLPAVFQAIVHLNAGDSSEGLQFAEKASDEFPDEPSVWTSIALAHLYEQAGKDTQTKEAIVHIEAAEKAAKKALEITPAHPLASTQLAEVLTYKNEPKQAVELLEGVISKPDLLREEVLVEARRQLIFALRRGGQAIRALEFSLEQVQAAGSSSTDVLYLAKGLRSAGRNQEAIVAFESLIESDPNKVTGAEWNDLGLCYKATGQFQKALEALKKAEPHLAGTVGEAQYFVNRAAVEVALGNYEDAVQMLSSTESSYDKNWMDYFYCHQQQAILLSGDLDAAMAITEKFPADRMQTEYGGIHIVLTQLAALADGVGEADWPYQAEWLAFQGAKDVGSEGWDFQFIERFVQQLPREQQARATDLLNVLKAKVKAK